MSKQFPNSNVYYSDTVSDYWQEEAKRYAQNADYWRRRAEQAEKAERQRIVNLLMLQHEAAKGAHNYWQVAANLIQADVASDT